MFFKIRHIKTSYQPLAFFINSNLKSDFEIFNYRFNDSVIWRIKLSSSSLPSFFSDEV